MSKNFFFLTLENKEIEQYKQGALHEETPDG